MSDGFFHLDDLVPVTDETPVEHIGGPDDGRRLPLTVNALRRNGYYVPLNSDAGVTAMIYCPTEPA